MWPLFRPPRSSEAGFWKIAILIITMVEHLWTHLFIISEFVALLNIETWGMFGDKLNALANRKRQLKIFKSNFAWNCYVISITIISGPYMSNIFDRIVYVSKVWWWYQANFGDSSGAKEEFEVGWVRWGELWNIKLGELGEVSFGMFKFGELGEVSFGITSWVNLHISAPQIWIFLLL